ncbi:MAG: hypothetical protein HYU69_13215 [Bacteroidetes bacterium]|nr:hypothetical protein [Bacteroidota bacterium]
MNTDNNIPDDFENLEKYAPTLSKVRKENCFAVPEGYFDELPEAIGIEIITSRFSKENPFTVPADYFNELSIDIEASVAATQFASEYKFDIPANYFDELPMEIEAKIIASSFPKENPFELPADYFDHLPAVIQDKISPQAKKVKVLSLDWFTKTQLLAVAASVVIVCLIGIKYWNKSNLVVPENPVAGLTKSAEKTLEDGMENVDESTLEEALSEEAESGSQQLQIASNDHIVEYLVDDHIDVNTLMNELNEAE